MARLSFPTCVDSGSADPSKGFAKWGIDNKRLGIDVINAIETLQPFNPATDSQGRVWSGVGHPVKILDDLWNCDKHKMPLEITGFYLGCGISGELPGGTIIALSPGIAQAPHGTAIEHDSPFLSLIRPDDNLTNNLQVEFAAKIGLKKNWPVPFLQGADELLVNLYQFVEHGVVRQLLPFLV